MCDLLCVQLASYLGRGALMHLHVNQKSDYDMMSTYLVLSICNHLVEEETAGCFTLFS